MGKEEQLLEKEEEKSDSKSLNDLFGMDFKEDGNWTATNMNPTQAYRKLNRHERRQRAAIERLNSKKY